MHPRRPAQGDEGEGDRVAVAGEDQLDRAFVEGDRGGARRALREAGHRFHQGGGDGEEAVLEAAAGDVDAVDLDSEGPVQVLGESPRANVLPTAGDVEADQGASTATPLPPGAPGIGAREPPGSGGRLGA